MRDKLFVPLLMYRCEAIDYPGPNRTMIRATEIENLLNIVGIRTINRLKNEAKVI